MKIAISLLFVLYTAFTMQAESNLQFINNLQFDLQNITIEKAIAEIEKKSDYKFLIADEAKSRLNKKCNLKTKDESIHTIMDKLLSDTELAYSILGKQVFIKRKETNPANKESRNQSQPKKKKITGNIRDEDGRPVVGATITDKNVSANGTISDIDGNFSLDVDSNAIINVSFLGYATLSIRTEGKDFFSITLKEEIKGLDEVVVIAYGTQGKKDLTGAIASVNIEDMSKSLEGSFVAALAGRVAGVQITTSDGQPGEASDIIIRGASSLSQSNSPLYVVDGFPLEDFNQYSVNSDDIASISILKDASSTAMYGSRAANGVVIIETKKGKLGKPVVTFNSSIGSSRVTRKIELMDPYEFIKFQIDKGRDTDVYFENGKTLNSYKDVEGVDFQDHVLQDALLQKYDIGVRGGSVDTKYAFSGSMRDQKGLVLNSGSRRYSARMSLEQFINEKLKIRGVMSYSQVTNSGSHVTTSGNFDNNISIVNYLFFNVWSYRPVSGNDDINLLDLDNDPDDEEVRFNPLRSLENDYVRRNYEYFTGNALLDYYISPALTLSIRGNISRSNSYSEEFYNSKTNRGRTRVSNTRGVHGGVSNSRGLALSNENILSFNKTFDKSHSVTALAGVSMSKNTSSGFGYWAEQVPNEALGISGLDEGKAYNISSTSTESRMLSFFGRVNYGYRSKYLFTATFRGDGSSKFAKGNKWGYFPSAAFAWNMHEENFMQAVKPVLSQSKLRLSYGLTGNNRVGDFSYMAQIKTSSYSPAYSFNNETPSVVAKPYSMGNPYLTWETTAQTDIGIDLGFLRNRIELTVDWYQKQTSDLLLLANRPLSTGFSTTYMNVGKTRNRGLEIELKTTNIKTNSFEWASGFNISFNSNKIIELTGETEMYSIVNWQTSYASIPAYISKVGETMGLFWGYIHDGNYQIEDFDYDEASETYSLKEGITTNGNARHTIQPGDIKYKDLNGDTIVNSLDRTVIGSPWPKHTGGFVNNFFYKNFDLNIFFQWSYGNKVMNANRYLLEGDAANYSFPINQYASYADRWTPENPTNNNFRANGQGPYAYSTRVLEDASFLRLKTISFGYNLPKSALKQLRISQLRLNITADNVFVWTKYSGFDPEVSIRNSALTRGLDFSAYPRARTVTFGFNLTL